MALDEERIMKETLDQIKKDMNQGGRDIGVTYKRDEGKGFIAFSLIEGDVNALRARAANLVGRANEGLEQQGRKSRFKYESTDQGALISIEKETQKSDNLNPT